MMSQTCKNAVRSLIYLASCNGDSPVPARIIAAEAGVPHQMLSKILHDLRNKGLVISTKGPGGGFQLAKPADHLKLVEVIEAIDGTVDLRDKCILGLSECNDEASCALHDFWKVFREQFLATISYMTLEDAAGVLERKQRQQVRKTA